MCCVLRVLFVDFGLLHAALVFVVVCCMLFAGVVCSVLVCCSLLRCALHVFCVCVVVCCLLFAV